MKSTAKTIVLLLVAFTFAISSSAEEPERITLGPASSNGKSQTLMRVQSAGVEMRLIDRSQRFTVQKRKQDVRLVQADDDLGALLDDLDDSIEEDSSTSEVDDLLNEARDLLKEEPASVPSFLPDTLDDGQNTSGAMRNRLKEEFDRLLPGDELSPAQEESSDGNVGPVPVEVEDEVIDDLVDPLPQPVYRPRKPRVNQPYTLAGILEDDDQVNRQCEAEFCRRMWECAGGKGQRGWKRACRDMFRNRQVIGRRGGRTMNDPMGGYADPNQCNQQYGSPDYMSPQSMPGEYYGDVPAGTPGDAPLTIEEPSTFSSMPSVEEPMELPVLEASTPKRTE